LWKFRELKRIKKDRDEREKKNKEKAEIERRRALTEEQRLEENAKLGVDKKPEKAKYLFLQKYYHKGAYY